MEVPAAHPALRRLAEDIYGSWLAMSLGLGILIVALPLYLLDAQASFTATSVVLAASGFGAMLGALPSGTAIAARGERPILVAALLFMAAAIALTATSRDPYVLTALQFAVGGGATAMRLAGQTLITRTIGPHARGRALSGLGGIRRLGGFVGPLIGGLMVDTVGFASTFLVSGVVTAFGLLPILMMARRLRPADTPVAVHPQANAQGMFASLLTHRRLLVRSTSGPFLIMAARRGRTILLPLVAAALGVSATAVGVVVAVGTGADLLLFPVAGWLMDRFGRLRAIGPAFTLMACGLVMLAFVDTTTGVVLAGTLIGVGNGLSAGTMMTLASDLAPADSPSQFMAGFATAQDLGQLVGPLMVGLIGDEFGLNTSAVVLAIMLVSGLGLIVAFVGETSQPTSRLSPDG